MDGLIEDLFQAVDHLHKNGIIHRDIKPANILMKQDQTSSTKKRPEWVLADFGLAVALKREQPQIEVVGTKPYLPPEVVKEKSPHGKEADIWLCGATLLKTLKNAYPSSGYTFSTEQWPYDVKVLLQACFKFYPKDRPSAKDVLSNMINRHPRRGIVLVDESNPTFTRL